MALLFALTAAAIGGIWYGVTRKKRNVTITFGIALLILWILAGIYFVIGLQNPY